MAVKSKLVKDVLVIVSLLVVTGLYVIAAFLLTARSGGFYKLVIGFNVGLIVSVWMYVAAALVKKFIVPDLFARGSILSVRDKYAMTAILVICTLVSIIGSDYLPIIIIGASISVTLTIFLFRTFAVLAQQLFFSPQL